MVVFPASSFADDTVHWIWTATEPAASKKIPFRKKLSIRGKAAKATLSCVSDHCNVIVRMGKPANRPSRAESFVAEVDAYSQPRFVDVTEQYNGGADEIRVEALAYDGPSAFALRLEVVDDAGKTTVVTTDQSWESVRMDPADEKPRWMPCVELSPVASFDLESERRFAITPVDDYTQWKQALGGKAGPDPATFFTRPGFVIEQIRSATGQEGSWVSMAFDSNGRIVIAREQRGLLRMTLADDHKSIARVEVVNDTLLECRGLLFAHDSLYANANNSKGLYRLRDTNGDDAFDEVKLLREIPGGVGHGRNDLVLGPRGEIYSIHGDAVDIPRDDVTDYTSPFRAHRRGKPSREGCVLKTDADGKNWEVLATGLRNPFGIAVNQHGDLFTYDADAEFDMGAPWYRPTRVLHLLKGGDFGWRGVTRQWPPYFPDHPDNAPPVMDIGKGSPTAVAFGYDSKFPPPYREALFVLDWAYGRVLTVHLEPSGASYRGLAVDFIKGRPLNVTDVAFGPDGWMYIITGGRKTQSGLYRIRYTGGAITVPPLTQQQIARRKHAKEARKLRRRLEGLMTKKRGAVEQLWPHLMSKDPVIRHAARVALEHQPLELWKARATKIEAPNQFPAGSPAAMKRACEGNHTALLALSRSGDPVLRREMLSNSTTWFQYGVAATGRFVSPAVGSSPKAEGELENPFPAWQRDAAIRIYEQCLMDREQFPESLRKRVVDDLMRFPAGMERPRDLLPEEYQAGFPRVLKKRAEMLFRERHRLDQQQTLELLFLLRNCKRGWTSGNRRAYFQALREAESYLGGEGMPGFVKQIREDAIKTLTSKEKAELGPLLKAGFTVPEKPIPQRPFVKKWTAADLDLLVKTENRDATRGFKLFEEALCSRCHRFGSRGTPVGPDLFSVGRRFNTRDILLSIIEPSRVVAEQYRLDRIATKDGKVHIGRILPGSDFRSPTLKIAIDALRPSQTVEVSKKDIVAHARSKTSAMPNGLLDSFTAEQIGDLLEFLEHPNKADGR